MLSRRSQLNKVTTNLDIVAIPEPAKLLLTGGIPDIESDGSSVGVEHKGVNLNESVL